MDMKKLIKETVREMILDGDIDLELVNVRDYIYPPKYELRIVVKNDEGKSEYNIWSGIEVEEIVLKGEIKSWYCINNCWQTRL